MFNEKIGRETDGNKHSQTNSLETYVNCLATSLKNLTVDRRKHGGKNLEWINFWQILAEKRSHFPQSHIIQHFPITDLNHFFMLLLSVTIIDEVFQQDEVIWCYFSDFYLADI